LRRIVDLVEHGKLDAPAGDVQWLVGVAIGPGAPALGGVVAPGDVGELIVQLVHERKDTQRRVAARYHHSIY
jgi:hypothetical protein